MCVTGLWYWWHGNFQKPLISGNRKVVSRIIFTVLIFSCPSSSIPTLASYLHKRSHTSRKKNYFFGKVFNCPWPPTLPSHSFENATNFHENLPKSNFWLSFRNFTILTKFHNFDQLSQFWPNFTILTKFHNVDQILQFWPHYTIFTKFYNVDNAR